MIEIKNQEIRNYVLGLTDFQKELVMAFREIVLSTDERIEEGIKWGSIAFFHKKNICGFRIGKNHISLLFMEGASLNDTYGILIGEGSKARSTKVGNPEEIHIPGIKDLVEQALRMGM